MSAARDDSRTSTAIAALLCGALAVWWAVGVNRDTAWGWDETMHAEYPAVRILLHARNGEWSSAWRALNDCSRYPFVWPVSLAAVQSVFGVSEIVCRMTARVVWAVGVFGMFLLAHELVQRVRPSKNASWIPWLALIAAATSPLALSFSGTLFLEIPFVVVSIFALRAWLLRGEARVMRRELAAGAWIALALFTKFNYGLLLGFGLALVWIVEFALELRAGRAKTFALRSAWLALPAAIACTWWFVVPLPFGAEMSRSHRIALVDFLSGNLDESMRTAKELLPLHATCFLVWAPRVFVCLAVSALSTLARIRNRAVWTIWIAWLASTLPVVLHPFHLDRFLLPGAVFLWLLAALGLARMLPSSARAKAIVAPCLAFALAFAPDVDSHWMLHVVGIDNPSQRDYQAQMLIAFRDLSPGRRLETNGFTRAESDHLLDLLQPEVKRDDRVAWVGMTQNFSPAALQVGLLERGVGAPAEIARGELELSYIDLGYVDPGWTRERILAWASAYSLIVTSDPIDLAGNPDRQYFARYRDELVSSGKFEARELGAVVISRPRGEIRSRLIALRPKR